MKGKRTSKQRPEARKASRPAKALYQLADALNRADTLEKVFDAALNAAASALPAKRTAILIAEDGRMQLKASRGLSAEFQEALHSFWPARENDHEVFAAKDVVELDLPDDIRRALQRERLRAFALVPMICQNRVMGQFLVAYKTPHVLKGEELQLARTIANQLALALKCKHGKEALREAQEQLAQGAVRLQETVANRTAELSATNKQMQAFVYTIAHDLRAPLRAMQGFATMLLEEAGESLTERGRDFAQRIHGSAKFMDTLLMDLLAFSQISQQQLEFRCIELQRVIDSTLAALEKEIQEKKAQINVVQPLPAVRAHEKTLQIVLQNLVSNALKFVSPGVEPQVRIHSNESGPSVRVWVEDNGIGISPEYQDQIFQIFMRVHGEDYPGTGIGLAIVQKGVERMGGRVGVESTPRQGSRFWIELSKA